MRDELEDSLGRSPKAEEWAEACHVDVRELQKRMRRANSARDLMVAANMRLVVSIVRPYLAPNSVAGGALSMEDLVQEGSVGLLKAVSRFRPERGHRFSTYATYWIRQGITRALADQSRTIRLPAYVHEFLRDQTASPDAEAAANVAAVAPAAAYPSS